MQESYPVKVILENDDRGAYTLNYQGPAYTLSNEENGFIVSLQSDEVKVLSFTTGSVLTITHGNNELEMFTLKLSSNRLNKKTVGTINYHDGKVIALSGDSNCSTSVAR